MRDPHNVNVYAESISLSKDIYSLTISKEEEYGLKRQIRRAAISIALNIAEGCARETNREYAQFLVQARGSNTEVQCALELGKELGLIDF